MCNSTWEKIWNQIVIGTITLPFIELLTNSWGPWTDNPLLGALFGGIVLV